MSDSPAVDLPVRTLTGFFRALGDETRLRIVALLSHGDLCVCHVESALGLSQPNASRHLAVLRAAGIVEGERRGGWVHYRLAPQSDPARKKHLAMLVGTFEEHARLQRDLVKIRRRVGPGACK
jgi:ArsR family transcriptional regulator